MSFDLGGCQTKAIHLQKKGGAWHLLNFFLMDAPPLEKCREAETLSQHFKALLAGLGNPRVKTVCVALGVEEAILKQIELPLIAPEDVRTMLRLNAKNYLQQDLPDHIFDCVFLPPRQAPAAPAEPGKPEAGKPAPAASQQKYKVLVTGTPRKTLENLQAAAKAAGLVLDSVVPSVVGPANAFEAVEPESFNKEIVGLVEIGFKHSSIVILDAGEIVLNRVVNLGSERLTLGLAEAMGISPSEAEGIKIGMPGEVQPTLEAVINPLGRELRASLDFFENQQNKTLGQIYVSGGAARNEIVVQALQNELMIPCKSWNPLRALQISVPAAKQGEVEQFTPQFSVAVGTAVASF